MSLNNNGNMLYSALAAYARANAFKLHYLPTYIQIQLYLINRKENREFLMCQKCL